MVSAREKSIAVLPFDNLSADPDNEYFSDGMTEEIINALSQIPGLKVTARTSSFAFKHRKVDIRTIGRDLGVSLILEGSVRKAGDQIRVTAQLIRTDNGFHLWSEKFDRNLVSIFELQDEISLLIAGKIREHFGHLAIQDHLVHVATDNIEAYQLYLKGRYVYNKWDMPHFEQAARYYQQSIEKDPAFDLPYFGAGLSFSFLGSWGGMNRQEAFRLAEEYFEQGHRLNRPSTYKQYAMAKHQFWGHWHYTTAYSTLLKAYTVLPDDADTNEFMAEIHILNGNFETALVHIEKSIDIDPLSPSHFYTKANIYYLQGLFEEALNVIEDGLRINPRFTILTELKVACHIHLGIPLEKDHLLWELYTVMRKLMSGPALADPLQLDELVGRIQGHVLLAWDLYLLAQSADPKRAMQRLEEMVAVKMGAVINLKYDPFLKPLQLQEGFQELVQRHFGDQKLTPVQVKPRVEHVLLSEEEARHFAQVTVAKMEQESYYLAADLSLGDLAEKLELHPNKLSWLLNNTLGKNFYDFVNGYRLRDFQQRAVDPKNKKLSLLGLAYESGFNSKSVFNDYFKKNTGMTPRAWVNLHIQE